MREHLKPRGCMGTRIKLEVRHRWRGWRRRWTLWWRQRGGERVLFSRALRRRRVQEGVFSVEEELISPFATIVDWCTQDQVSASKQGIFYNGKITPYAHKERKICNEPPENNPLSDDWERDNGNRKDWIVHGENAVGQQIFELVA